MLYEVITIDAFEFDTAKTISQAIVWGIHPALFMALAIIPVGLTRRLAPAPLGSTRIRFSLLYSRSRSAFAGALLSGLVVGGFWSLGAVFARSNSVDQSDISYNFV